MKKVSKMLVVLLALVMALSISGCGGSDSGKDLVGTWSLDYDLADLLAGEMGEDFEGFSAPLMMSICFEFKEDNTFRMYGEPESFKTNYSAWLDEFLAFVSDEDHAILMSSHITSDLEKVADYIAYIHQGQVVLSAAKDAILDSYGRVGCTAAQLETIDRADVLRTRKGAFGCEALVADRVAFSRKYPMLLVERTTLEDIMLFVGKGETK